MILLSISQTLTSLWGKAWPILLAILFFGLLIMIHELGHFFFAKLFKVKVNQFAMGMGPKIFSFGKKETEYSLRLFPVGGYVAMEGEDEESSNDRAFGQKKVWQRMLILAAGAMLNLILGFFLVIVMFAVTKDLLGSTIIHSFRDDVAVAKSQETGLAARDQILKINGKRVFADTDVFYMLMRDKDGVFDMQVRREGKKVDLKNVTFETEERDGKNTIIYDFKILGYKKEDVGFLGMLKTAAKESLSLGRVVWLSLFDLVTGQYGMSDLSGPVGTVNIVAQAANVRDEETGKRDFTPMLHMMALISINIGIFNLLPLPALDGGRLFFLFIELIFRKKVPAKYEGWVHAVGLALLMLLMLAVTFSDILKLIRD